MSEYTEMKIINSRTGQCVSKKPYRQRILGLCEGAVVAAIYVALTYLAGALGMPSGVIQLRFSEALCILPFFFSSAVPGLWIGCIIANLLTGSVIWDIVFGSLATLIGAVGAYLIGSWVRHAHRAGKNKAALLAKLLLPLPTVVANGIIVPFVLQYAYGINDPIGFLFITVTVGEILSAYVLGLLLLFSLEKKNFLSDRYI